ncbi:MAG: hypothetical protein A2Y62_01355 [Candidatus Fischerbacteria bacterium RBG_13_37_8]|uniref:Uncharacterized protein n=1 Tax=Candidatus Fischerbacteria bacterium RBG_13_37_8 TaxID=1817863 RepID=A0A1F5VTR0_9BACT|nr:MAG: hypothetical protein A2Y62_01355 [Candidatus Fischerbacteria bacterium RBG_13_37_8]
MAKKQKKIIAPKCTKKLPLSMLLLLFTTVAFVLYSHTFSTPFILDDFRFIVDNNSLHNNSIYTHFNLPRYVGYVSFGLNYLVNKLQPAGYHLANILVHIINAFLIVLLFRKLFDRLSITKDSLHYHYLPALAALLFLVHPLQTQSVTYIVQRLASLAAMFTLISLLAYIIFKDSGSTLYGYYFISLLSALLAFKTKENTATLPLVLITIELLFYKKSATTTRKKMALLIPFFLLLTVIPISMTNFDALSNKSFTEIITSSNITMSELFRELSESTYQTADISRNQYLLTQFRVITVYIKMLLLPVNQSLYHLFPFSHSLFEMNTMLSLCLLLIMIATAFGIAKKYPEISFGILWFFIFLLVESSIVPIYDVIFEHRVYLPSIGFIIAFIYTMYYCIGKKHFKAMLAIIIVIVLILSVLTYRRNLAWKNEISIWKDVVEKYPGSYLAHGALGTAYGKINRCDEAIKEFQASLNILPTYIRAYNNLATCHIKQGSIQKAIDAYKTAVTIMPDYVLGYYNLGSLYYQNKQLTEALLYLHKAYDIDPNHPMVNAQLGNIYCHSGYLDDGKLYYQQAITLQPHDANIYYNYGICLLTYGLYKEARDNFLKALELNPADVDNYYFIASCYDNEQEYEQAISYYSQFISKAHSNEALTAKAHQRLEMLGMNR